MYKGLFKKILPHLIAVVAFLIVAIIYCKPALEGKVLQQPDIIQWTAMAQNSFEYKETHGRFPLWSNGMFSGMPGYQIAMSSDNAVSVGIFYTLLTLGLPKPISFFFLACICFYILSQALRINPYLGIVGALCYAYATYNPVIIVEGHDTKMQSIAMLPAFIGGLILLYDKKYWLGGSLTALFTALLIGFNHFQIIYYGLFIALFLSAGYIVYSLKRKEVKHLILACSIAIVAGLLGVLANALSIFTTYEYSKETIRGGSEMAGGKESNVTKTGLSEDYAFSYSMYKTEPLVMISPNVYGGASIPIESLKEDSKTLETLQSIPQEVANQIAGARTAYWGGIGIASGPPYVGAIICFLALIGFFILDNKHKWWILAASAISIMMSWGGYFEGFNRFLLDTLPMYDKFRAPSMIIVIPTFLFGLLAMMSLQKIISAGNRIELLKNYKKGLILTAGIFAILLLVYLSADFRSESDKSILQQISSLPDQVRSYFSSFFTSLKNDRQSLFLGSITRSFLYVAVAAFILWLGIRNKIKTSWVLFIVGALSFIDIISIDTNYLNADNFQDETDYKANFAPSQSDLEILTDTSYYRVFDIRQGLSVALGMQGALPSYFHKSIGGYHAAKLSIYQDLIAHQLMNFPKCLPVINMLNTKYIIQADQTGKETVITNPDVLGPAWFVKAIKYQNTPAQIMSNLTSFNPKDTAIVFAADKGLIANISQTDSTATIQLIKNDNDVIIYQSNSSTPGFGVFSEVFYSKGWKAYIDEKEIPIIRTNYVLRGLSIPAGQHAIRFEFKPASYYTGNKISLIASLIIIIALMIAGWQLYKNSKLKTKTASRI
jgi:hypothetical protein